MSLRYYPDTVQEYELKIGASFLNGGPSSGNGDHHRAGHHHRHGHSRPGGGGHGGQGGVSWPVCGPTAVENRPRAGNDPAPSFHTIRYDR